MTHGSRSLFAYPTLGLIFLRRIEITHIGLHKPRGDFRHPVLPFFLTDHRNSLHALLVFDIKRKSSQAACGSHP